MVIGLGVILPAAPGHVGNFEYFTVLGLCTSASLKNRPSRTRYLRISVNLFP
jgi:hypothetical protein